VHSLSRIAEAIEHPSKGTALAIHFVSIHKHLHQVSLSQVHFNILKPWFLSDRMPYSSMRKVDAKAVYGLKLSVA